MKPPRIPLIQAPTPLHRLERASEKLGIDLWIKRDDLTGFALGGNKGRKLEYIIADAMAKRADVVVTCGSVQSNFVRQLGASCAIVGIDCVAVVMDLPYEEIQPAGVHLRGDNGNALLDKILNVNLIKLKDGTWEELYLHTSEVAARLRDGGKVVYEVPIGGSSHLGAYAFYRAAEEMIAQCWPMDWIVTSSSSGSTQTGLTYGLSHTTCKVLGVSADPEPEMICDLVALGNKLAGFLEIEPISPNSFHLNLDFFGKGYGVSDPETLSAIEWLAQTEGIFLDPIYSGKAFRCLMSLAQSGQIEGRILFWHTGGLPALFAV